MDSLKQVNKTIRKKHEESSHNTRRVAEDFPFVERKIDDIVFDKPYKMEFTLSGHPHTVHLNVYFKTPENCFQCNPLYTGMPDSRAVGTCPQFGPADGTAYPGIYSSLEVNTGGYAISPTGGIIVPKNGYYNIRFLNSIAGVAVASNSSYVASVRVNGIVVAQRAVSRLDGTLVGTGFYDFDMPGLCIFAREGDVIGGWLAAAGIAFYTPSNFCGLAGTSKTYITLVGLA